jgi:imidazolonepropionase-like amidohydrolase
MHCLLLAAVLLAPPAAQGSSRAFVGARIEPVAGVAIDDGVLVVREGKIAYVGADRARIPADAERIDVAGKVLMPGLVDTHSHIGGPVGADQSAPLQPECRVLDSLDVRDAGFAKARAGGITTVNVMSGSGHLLSGQTVYLKLRAGNTIDELLLRNADGSPQGGIKMANGTNPMRDPPFPGTRGKSAALVRALFVKAREYRDAIVRAQGDPEKMPARDLGLEALVDVLERERVVHHHTHRHDDILTVLRLSAEFGFRVVLHHVSDAWKVADQIAAAGAPCSVILLDSPGGKLEAAEISFRNGAVLEQAGVLTAFHTDDGITDSRFFRRMAALAVRAGMSRQKALESLTLAGARMLDLGERVGSLEVGKDADIVVLSGDPFSVYTRTEQTWVEGELVFDYARERDRLSAEGGFGASAPQAWYFCCFGQGGGQ